MRLRKRNTSRLKRRRRAERKRRFRRIPWGTFIARSIRDIAETLGITELVAPPPMSAAVWIAGKPKSLEHRNEHYLANVLPARAQ